MPRREITATGLAVLSSYDWPGNVRELKNVLERATLVSDNLRLTAEDFQGILPSSTARRTPIAGGVPTYDEAFADFERRLLQAALTASGGRVIDAAKLIGISRAAFYKKLADLNAASTETAAGKST